MISPANTSQNPVALEMKGISKRFGPVQALLDVSLTLRTGTIHALVGENGAGKSTLMKILAGVYKGNTGLIQINGRTRVFDNPNQAIAAGVSMIYQDLDLAEHLTVAQNVFLGSEPKALLPFSIDHKKMSRQTADLADKYDFDIAPDAVVANLSTGDCQVAEILKALARSATILVMDEPTSSLSEKETERLFKIIKNLRAKGISIIYISHRLEEIIGLADDITILRDGRVVHHEVNAKLDIPKIVHHMVGRELTEFFPPRDVTMGDVRVAVENLSTNEVSDISFEIKAGEIVGMAGLVGAGRTEIARAVFGIDKKIRGSVKLDGEIITITRPADAIKAGIAYLTEDRKRTGLCLQLPCAWNITLPSLDMVGPAGLLNLKKENKLAAGTAEQLAIKWTSPASPADSLSGGNQQKLLIARWLLKNARFMLFDEPTRGIDVGSKKEIYSLLNEFAAQRKAILFVSSELPELLGVTDRILVMRRGKLVANLETKQTNQQEVMHLAAVEKNE
jgi:ribose transport system ATP-binding protein